MKLGPYLCPSWKSEHNEREFFLIGQEEHPVHCVCARIEWEVSASTTNGNASWEENNKTSLVVLARRENRRHEWAQRPVIILNMTRRIPCLLWSRAEIKRGARDHNGWKFFSRGREEDPVFCAWARRKQEVHTRTMNGDYSHPLCISLFPLPPTSPFLKKSICMPNYFTPARLHFCNWTKQFASSLSIFLEKLNFICIWHPD